MVGIPSRRGENAFGVLIKIGTLKSGILNPQKVS
jgi:hypothetical protein